MAFKFRFTLPVKSCPCNGRPDCGCASCSACAVDCTARPASYTINFSDSIAVSCCLVMGYGPVLDGAVHVSGINKDLAEAIALLRNYSFLLDQTNDVDNAPGCVWQYATTSSSLLGALSTCDDCASSSYTTTGAVQPVCTASYDTAGCGLQGGPGKLLIELGYTCRYLDGVLQGRWQLHIEFDNWTVSGFDPDGHPIGGPAVAILYYDFDSGWFNDTGQSPFFSSCTVTSTCDLCTECSLTWFTIT